MTRTILLADDSVTIQKVIELTFMDDDYEVVAVGTGDEALEKLEELTPDFVIADVHMPGASGYEVAKHSKSLRPEVPVLLLVSTFEPFDEAEAERSGCDAFLKKPFDSQELQRLVEELSAEARGEAATETSGVWGGEEPAGFGAEGEEPAPYPVADVAAPAEAAHEAPREPAFAAGADDDETAAEPFSIGFEDDEEMPPTRVSPPPEAATAAAGEEPFGGAWATQAEPEVFELEPEELGSAWEGAEPEPPAAEWGAEPEPPAAGASPLSDADVDRIARRVVELLGDKAVRDVAWEVVPDLAEVVIRSRLQELETQAESAE
jgi:CheY-like chemotaxis protein